MPVRKRLSKMTAGDKKRFVDVITALIADGTYGPLVAIHADMSHNMHSMNAVGQQRFLPWHRAYLLKLEAAMVAKDPKAFIPYWPWTTQHTIPKWLAAFTPVVNVPGVGNVQVARNPGAPPPLPSKGHIADVLDETTYTDFTAGLEGAHNDVHVWVGGSMGVISTAPTDPIFWIHHAQVDRLWSVWQAANPGLDPALAGADRILDPWADTEPSVRSIAALGYSYGP